MSRAKKILFVCTGNTCRSYMAESIAADYLKKSQSEAVVLVSSAGLACPSGDPAEDKARTVLAEMGLTNDHHRTQRLNSEMVQCADLILVMTESHREMMLRLMPGIEDKLYLLKEYIWVGREEERITDLDVADPFGGTIEDYRLCIKEISNLVIDAVEKYLNSINKK